MFKSLVNSCRFLDLLFKFLPIRTYTFMSLPFCYSFKHMFTVILAVCCWWNSVLLKLIQLINISFRLLHRYLVTDSLVLQKTLYLSKNVHKEVSAVVNWLASSVFTPCHMKLILALVIHLVVRIVRTDENL